MYINCYRDKKNGKITIQKIKQIENYNYSEDGWYYVTICSNNRKNIFGAKLNHQPYRVGTALAAVRNNIQNQNNIAIELAELGKIIKQQLTKIESN